MLKSFFNHAPKLKKIALLLESLGTGDATWAKCPAIKRVLEVISAPPVPQRLEVFMPKCTFKVKMDAMQFMFPQNERLGTV